MVAANAGIVPEQPCRRMPAIAAWGTRLSDAVRSAIAADDLVHARRLAHQGDGLTRSIASEYSLMIRGLGATVTAILRLLPEVGERHSDDPHALNLPISGLAESPVATGMRIAPERSDATAADARQRALDAGIECLLDEQTRLASNILAALDAGHAKVALELLDTKERRYLAWHDPIVRFMADAFAWTWRFGDRALLDLHLACAQAQRAGFEKWERLSGAEFAAATALLLRQHMGQLAVQEDARCFTIRQSPCGSGGRLRLSGAYEGAQALPHVVGPGPLTFGEARMPVYCTHCAIWNGTATLQWFGRAQWVFDEPARADGGCVLRIYKRREDTPAEYACRVGLPCRAESR